MWKEITLNDTQLLGRLKQIMMQMDSGYIDYLTVEFFKKFFTESTNPHIYYYKDGEVECVFAIRNLPKLPPAEAVPSNAYEIDFFGFVGTTVNKMLKIAGKKLYDVMNEENIETMGATVPDVFDNQNLVQFFSKVNLVWDLEVEQWKNCQRWTFRKGKDKPFIHEAVG